MTEPPGALLWQLQSEEEEEEEEDGGIQDTTC